MDATTSTNWSRTRKIALRGAAVPVLLLGLLGAPVIVLALLAWLPEAALVSILGYPEGDLHHLVHGVGIGVMYVTIVVTLAVQLRRPHRWVAPLWLLAFVALALAVRDLAMGTVEADTIIGTALVATVVAVHPRRTAPAAVHRPSALVALAGAVPLLIYAVQEARLQLGPDHGLGHVADNHHGTMVILAGLIIVAAALGATDLPGRRLVSWISGLAAVLLGVVSLAHPGLMSALATGWAAAAVGWGVVYVLVANLRPALRPARRAPATTPAAR